MYKEEKEDDYDEEEASKLYMKILKTSFYIGNLYSLMPAPRFQDSMMESLFDLAYDGYNSKDAEVLNESFDKFVKYVIELDITRESI